MTGAEAVFLFQAGALVWLGGACAALAAVVISTIGVAFGMIASFAIKAIKG